MDSFGNPYRNYTVEYIEEERVKKASRIPKGKTRRIKIVIIVDEDNLFEVNDTLRKYPHAYVNYNGRYTKVTGRLTKERLHQFMAAATPFYGIRMCFYFTAEGTGTSESRCTIC